MKKGIFFSAGIIVLFSCSVAAQTYLTMVKPVGSQAWGYANSKGELVIPAQYAACSPFSSDGFAPIYDREQMQYSFINTKGQTLITEIRNYKLMDGFGFDVTGFSDGLVPVRVEK